MYTIFCVYINNEGNNTGGFMIFAQDISCTVNPNTFCSQLNFIYLLMR